MHRLIPSLTLFTRKQQRHGLLRQNYRAIQTGQQPKLHQMTVCERRELFGLPNHVEPMAEKNIAKIPLGVVQLPSAIFNQSFYPLKQEEASVIAGATGMGKLVETLNIKKVKNTLMIECVIPFNRLQKDEVSGHKMAEGIYDIYNAARKDPLRAITNNKGIINATFPYLDALIPSNAIKATAILLSHAIDSGIDFKSNRPQYGPLVHWEICYNSTTLIGRIKSPILDTYSLNKCDEKLTEDAVAIFGKENTKDPTLFAKSTGVLAILQNLAALRSIFFKGNRAHHMDHHNAGTGDIVRLDVPQDVDGTSNATMASLVENYVTNVNIPLNSFSVAGHSIVVSGLFDMQGSNAVTLLNHCDITIETKTPEIIAQIFYRQINKRKQSTDRFISMLNDPLFLAEQNKKIMATDEKNEDNTLNRLEKRLGHSLIIQNGHDVVQLGNSTVRQNVRLHVGETQGANRANAYAELCRQIMNKMTPKTGWEAKGGILSNYHTDRGPTFNATIDANKFTSLGLNLPDIVKLSKDSINDSYLANEINIAALEGMIGNDLATGQDSRGNIASFLFAATENNNGHARPFIVIEHFNHKVIIRSGFPMASARTAVGRVVNALDSVRIAREEMGIPIDGNATGKVNQLDEKACLAAITRALNKVIELSRST
ncbi:MAG: hypothetical protein ACON35_07795 [Candidatus Marinamargulisbacteria bacterium]